MNNTTYYYDPNHGGCLRIMHKMSDNEYAINGHMEVMKEKKDIGAQMLKVKEFDYKGKTYNFIVDFKIKVSKLIKVSIMLT